MGKKDRESRDPSGGRCVEANLLILQVPGLEQPPELQLRPRNLQLTVGKLDPILLPSLPSPQSQGSALELPPHSCLCRSEERLRPRPPLQLIPAQPQALRLRNEEDSHQEGEPSEEGSF